jgi:hypothetical protein
VGRTQLSGAAAACIMIGSAWGQAAPAEPKPIQDNSFLVEEAYNQESGVVQHIHTFSRVWNSRDWTYSFTQEVPMPGRARHQLSYTFSRLRVSGMRGTGDTLLNYRYQLVGSGDARVAFAPRVSLLLATGDPVLGTGTGGTGVQANLPLSVALSKRLVSHTNVGTTVVRAARSAEGFRAGTAGVSYGQSLVVLAHPRFNVLLEAAGGRYQSVVGMGRTEWTGQMYLSPGVRWAYNFANGLQVVPGVAMPVGVGPSAGSRSLFVYLSLEHPLRLFR